MIVARRHTPAGVEEVVAMAVVAAAPAAAAATATVAAKIVVDLRYPITTIAAAVAVTAVRATVPTPTDGEAAVAEDTIVVAMDRITTGMGTRCEGERHQEAEAE